MALSQLRMHHLATGALPPRTNEECEYVEALEGADADAGCDAPADLPTDPPADPPAATPMESPGDPPADPPADAPAGALAEMEEVASIPLSEGQPIDGPQGPDEPAPTQRDIPPFLDPENVTAMHKGRPAPSRRRR